MKTYLSRNVKRFFNCFTALWIGVIFSAACSKTSAYTPAKPIVTLTSSSPNTTPAKSVSTSTSMPSLTATSDSPKPTHTIFSETAKPLEIKCPGVSPTEKLLEAKSAKEARQMILNYLNRGGSPDQIESQVGNLGKIVKSSQAYIIDINQDKISEIVIAINFNPPETGSWDDLEGYLSVYSCINSAYQVQDIIGSRMVNTEILQIEDIFDTPSLDILAKRIDYFMTGYSDVVELYSLNRDEWKSYLESDYFPHGIQVEIKDVGDGGKELAIEGLRGCSYMACGPSRSRRVIYWISGKNVELRRYELLPSPYRIHFLEDGDIALRDGKLEEAVLIYDKAARDNNLLEHPTTYETTLLNSNGSNRDEVQRLAHTYQTSFAYFREFAILLYLDRQSDAEKVLQQIRAVYPEGKEGNEFVDISLYLLGQVNSGVGVQQACVATNDYIADEYILGSNDFVYWHLNGWGDLSPQIGERLCPELE